jgi:peptidoglycan hydrolase FlgJ
MTVQGIATSDFSHLNELKAQAKGNAEEALPEVAKQFEAIFLQAMLKSMRAGQHFLDESSPFNGKNQETFQDMLDGQYSSSISGGQGIGLAEMLAKQLSKTVKNQLSSPTQGNQVSTTNMVEPMNVSESKNKHQTSGIDDFIKSIWPMAKEAAASIGLDPKVLIAQAALETGWGKSITKGADGESSNNLFNIKSSSSKNHDSVTVKTTEYIADTPIKMNASFRKYNSIEQSFSDYISFIKGNERYHQAVANASNPEQYVKELHKAGYATDPNYSSKILSIYHGDELNHAIERCGLVDAV